ncbi:hypothetical protein EV175_007106 [Coemansia sp. RSA 1933]|nr:hypothetical protein EV175_007106 [Coemansia sp. RSA 1933]
MVNMADAKYIGQYTNLINKEPDGFMRQVNGLSKYRHRLIVSNQISFNHYDVDFGVGIPVLVRLAIISFPHSAFIMPSRPGDDGYEITMTLTADVASKLVQNTHWMNIVDSYDFDV